MMRYGHMLALSVFVWSLLLLLHDGSHAFQIPSTRLLLFKKSFIWPPATEKEVVTRLQQQQKPSSSKHTSSISSSSSPPRLHSERENGTAILQEETNATLVETTTSPSQHNKKKTKDKQHRPVLPFLRVNWSSNKKASISSSNAKAAVARRENASHKNNTFSSSNTVAATHSNEDNPATLSKTAAIPTASSRKTKGSSKSSSSSSSSCTNKSTTPFMTNHTIQWQPSETTTTTTTTAAAASRPASRTTPMPVAETLLRTIYDRASGSTEMAWNMSLPQFFPPTTTAAGTTGVSAATAGSSSSSGSSSMLDFFENMGNFTLDTAGKNSTDVLTVQDLEKILLENGFVRQVDVAAVLQRTSNANNFLSTTFAAQPGGGGGISGFPASQLVNQQQQANQKGAPIEGIGQPVGDLIRGGNGKTASSPGSTTTTATSSSTSSPTVAWPQPSVLSYTSLKWGVTVASGFSCTILAASIFPSLWLMGGLVGSVYGFQTGKRLSDGTVPKSFFPSFLLVFGRRIAKSYLQVYDMVNALFFMYKTGQLSYDMYKRYATLDERFRIQDKIDAWNAVFVEGKENFDKWEKENEVGRKVLATLRTAWLVEERSLKRKVRKRSRYRVVQLLYDGAYFAGRLVASLWRLISGQGSTQELSEFLRGIQLDISKARLDEIGSRIGACITALIAVNITGALFTLSPTFLGIIAIFLGLVWPTWFPELLDRTRRLTEDTRAKGRGDETKERQSKKGTRGVDKNRYSFYITRDGKKRYYRVTQTPLFRQRQNEVKQGFRWPWQKPEEPKRPSIFDFRI